MRKLTSYVAASVLVASGLVGVSASQSAAEPGRGVSPGCSDSGPYPDCVQTTCTARAINNPRVGQPVKAKLRVDPGEPRGWATFSYERKRNGLIVAEYRRRYRGPGWNKYSYRRKLPRGNYVVRVWFNSTPSSSVYTNCRDTFEQRVRGKRR